MNIEEIRTLIPGKVLWDKEDRNSVKGLHVKATPTGQRSFYLYYRTKQGAQRRPKLGTFGEITLAEARKQAKGMLSRVAVGEDPKGDWNAAKAEMTVQQLFETVFAEYWNKPRFIESEWAENVSLNWKNHLKETFGGRRLSEVTVVDVRRWHSKYKDESPYVGNRSLSVFSRMFSYAEEQGWRQRGSNPCALVPHHKERKRKRFASADEIKKIYPLLEKMAERSPAGVAFLYILMFSGSRPRAIERATWDQLKVLEVEGQRFGVLTFEGKSTAKTGEEETVILPPAAMRVIDKLPKTNSAGTITGIKMPNNLWREIRKDAGCKDLWARDWRRTFATIGTSDGLSLSIIGELLNHKSTQTTKIYGQVMQTAKIQAAGAIAEKIETLLKS